MKKFSQLHSRPEPNHDQSSVRTKNPIRRLPNLGRYLGHPLRVQRVCCVSACVCTYSVINKEKLHTSPNGCRRSSLCPPSRPDWWQKYRSIGASRRSLACLDLKGVSRVSRCCVHGQLSPVGNMEPPSLLGDYHIRQLPNLEIPNMVMRGRPMLGWITHFYEEQLLWTDCESPYSINWLPIPN